jgi:hypothetical protein
MYPENNNTKCNQQPGTETSTLSLFLCGIVSPPPGSCNNIGPGGPSALGDNGNETAVFKRREGREISYLQWY